MGFSVILTNIGILRCRLNDFIDFPIVWVNLLRAIFAIKDRHRHTHTQLRNVCAADTF